MSELIDNLEKFFESEEGKASIEKWHNDILNEKLRLESWVNRFHNKHGEEKAFRDIVERIKKKYDSDEYHKKEYKIGYEPRKPLYDLIFEYAKAYGREATKMEWDSIACDFTAELLFLHGYYIELCQGQGAFIAIFESEVNKEKIEGLDDIRKYLTSIGLFETSDVNTYHNPKVTVTLFKTGYKVTFDGGDMYSEDHNIYWLVGVLTYYNLINVKLLQYGKL